jgi:hypothetical protein
VRQILQSTSSRRTGRPSIGERDREEIGGAH